MRTFNALLVLIVAALFLGGTAAADNKYVGAKFCGMCHKTKEKGEAYAVWEKSAHARAFETLKTKAADEFAKKRGLKTPAAESPECLKCHVTGGGAPAAEPTFKKEEGVTCEACHGAASAYKMIHTKGDLAKSKAAGLVLPDKTDAKFCEKCHNAESPTFKGFKIAEMWAKIEHHGPPKK